MGLRLALSETPKTGFRDEAHMSAWAFKGVFSPYVKSTKILCDDPYIDGPGHEKTCIQGLRQ